MKEIAALYVRNDSVYKEYPIIDCYDIDRDARTFKGGMPVIAHPPCRAWGKLKAFAKPRSGEKELALHAVQVVRENGGVLEHPSGSSLFGTILPRPGKMDEWGFTLSVNQFWFGHKAQKKTYLYIVGIKPHGIPEYPISFDLPTHGVSRTKNLKEISKADRERTPRMFAEWLIETAILIKGINLPFDF